MRNNNGFTLLEVLVVLLLVSLLATLLTQGLFHVLALRSRVLEQVKVQREYFLHDRWLRQICVSLTPGLSSDEAHFAGTEEELSGFTFTPLKGEPGAPTPISLNLTHQDNEMVLQYSEGHDDDPPWDIGRWPAGEGKFSYLNPEGDWLDSWPPAMGTAEALPVAIKLEIEGLQGPVAMLMTIAGRRQPKPTLLDVLKSI